MTNRKALLRAVGISLLAALAAFGQTATSTLSGTVRDEAGAVVSGATF